MQGEGGQSDTDSSSSDAGARFRGRDAKTREQNGFRRQGDTERRPGSREEYRYWRSAGNELPGVSDKFVMVSYNILADKNASEHYNGLYYHIPWRLMEWERRKNKIVQELGLWSPDIICLQEVDQFHDLREEFDKRGYQGTYKARTGGAGDGCAMFWRSTRFRLLQDESIQFKTLGLRDNVAQICALQSIGLKRNRPPNMEADLPDFGSTGNVVIVGNIHVLFNPKRGDIKLGQVRVLLESAHALSHKWNDAPVVIGGDFNSTPASSIYQYLANSKAGRTAVPKSNLVFPQLDISCLNRQNLSGQVEADEACGSSSLGSSVRFSRRNDVSQSVESRYAQAAGAVMDVRGTEPDMGRRTDVSQIIESRYAQSVGAVLDGDVMQLDMARCTESFESSTAQAEGAVMDIGVAKPDMAAATEFVSYIGTITRNEKCSTSNGTGTQMFVAESSRGWESQTNKSAKRWLWTPDEIVAATGTLDNTVVRHKLRLRSVYTEIEGEGGCRDPQGEPLVTTYHKKFMGTVDYIWHTEGLDTVRVLDTLPVNVLQRCQGLPSQKWGSDHLALACELAFHPPA